MVDVIHLVNPSNSQPLTSHGSFLADSSGNKFTSHGGIYRFVEHSNYAESFGFQWNRFQQTQIDRYERSSQQSTERFFAATGWQHENLEGQVILEVGSGAGRFTSVVLRNTKGTIYTVDYSTAVEANMRNNGPDPRLHIFQASIYGLPFSPAQFDKVFCFGVLQHTPDFRRSIQCLTEMVRPGGELIVDFYPVKGWYTKIHSKYLFRPVTKRMDHETLLRLIEKNVDWLISTYRFFAKIGLGKVTNRFLPICDISRTIPKGLSKAELREWVILDTFDMFSPEYDNPQRLDEVIKWFDELGMRNVRGSIVPYGDGNTVYVVRGSK